MFKSWPPQVLEYQIAQIQSVNTLYMLLGIERRFDDAGKLVPKFQFTGSVKSTRQFRIILV